VKSELSIRDQLAKLGAEILAKPIQAIDVDAEKRRADVTAAGVEALKRVIGRRYSMCRLDTFKLSADPTVKNLQQTTLASLQAFVDDLPNRIATGSGLFIYGPAGSGKDHLLSSVLFEAAGLGFSVHWVNGVDAFGRFRDNIRDGGDESDLIRKLVAPAVLAISDPVPPIGDVGTYQRSMLFRVFDRRYRDRKPTWITANVAGRDEADKRLGVQLVDRLTDESLSLGCNWPSYRLERRWRPVR